MKLKAVTSVPVVPAQPDLAQYGLLSLAIFQRFTRESYLSTFGVQAPPFDPTRRPKDWFDTSLDVSNPEDVVTYLRSPGPDKNGVPQPLKNFGITIKEASTVNLPGAYTYPPFVVAPTGATTGGAGMPAQGINPTYLCLPEEAEQMAAELTAASQGTSQQTTFTANESRLGGPFAYIYPADEPRRVFDVKSADGKLSMSAGLLRQEKLKNGVGRPGKWVFGQHSDGEPMWVPEPLPATSNNLPAWDTPLRPLLENEKLVIVSPFSGVVIQRTDKQLPGGGGGGGGDFTEADRAMLADIQKKVAQLLKLAVG